LSEKKVSRRGYLKYVAGGIVVVAATAAGTYYVTRPAPIAPTTATITATATATATATPAGMEKKYPGHMVNLDTTTPYIGCVYLGLSNPWDALNRKGFEWYCGDVLKWKYDEVWPDGDVGKQNDGTEELIKKGVDALIVCPEDSAANAKIGEMAKEADIPVVEFGIDMKHDWPLAFYQRDDAGAGAGCGKFIVNALKAKYGDAFASTPIKVLQCHGYRGSDSDYLRGSGFYDEISTNSNISIIEVGNSWVDTDEYPKIKAALMANPDIEGVFEEMGGFHEDAVKAASDLGWSEDKIKALIMACDDCFPVNIAGFKDGTQKYSELMPTGMDMMAPALETLREYWKHGPSSLPVIGDTFTAEKYVPEIKLDATADDFTPLKWFNDPVNGVTPTDIRPAPLSYSRPWINLKDRLITAQNYTSDFIYWNWPIWGLSG
jgi:ABC-type sugar transport system substrate-binding protein